VTLYAFEESGELALADQLETDWPYIDPVRVTINAEHERVVYSLSVDDSAAGRLGVIGVVDGELRASALLDVEQLALGAVNAESGVLAMGEVSVQPVRITPELDLSAEAPLPTALEHALHEVEHGARIWSVHRNDEGVRRLRVRDDELGPARDVPLSHPVETVLPLDDSHIAAFGLSNSGQCEMYAELYRTIYPEGFPGCRAQGFNGVSVLSFGDGHVQTVQSFELSARLLPAAPAGVNQWLDWAGYLERAPGEWLVVGRLSQECSSRESCDAIGVFAHPVHATPGGCLEPSCPPPQEVTGYLNETVLVPLDLSNPGAPGLGSLIRGDSPHALPSEHHARLEPFLLGYEQGGAMVRAYASKQELYDEQGNGIDDGQGRGLSLHYLQFLSDEPGFGARVNVPGVPLLLTAPGVGSNAEHAAFTLEPRYTDDGSQIMQLHRLRIAAGVAEIEATLDMGMFVSGSPISDGRLALLRLPHDYCAEGIYELVIADGRSTSLELSKPLALPHRVGQAWRLSAGVSALDGEWIHVEGGPAFAAGRLVVDVNADPPRIVRYETVAR